MNSDLSFRKTQYICIGINLTVLKYQKHQAFTPPPYAVDPFVKEKIHTCLSR